MKRSDLWVVKHVFSADPLDTRERFGLYTEDGEEVSLCEYSTRDFLDGVVKKHNESYKQEEKEHADT